MADPKKSLPNEPRPSIEDRTPFHTNGEDFETWLEANFPNTPAGHAAMKEELEQERRTMQQRFTAAGWTFED